MEKMEDALKWCRRFYQTYEKQVKIAVIALVVVTALVLFGRNGENQEIVVEQIGETQSQLTENSDSETLDNADGSDEGQVKTKTVTKLVVDISGCVKTPGVYEVEDSTRLHQVIEMAGGLTDEADVNAINQAELVMDGQKILIPEKLEGESISSSGGTQGTVANSTANSKININQADSTMLQEIPGVGPATADKIIQYREANGRFQTIEDIKNVSGIGDKTFEKMKEKICV